MIVIFFSWFILFFCFLTFGIATEFLLKIKSKNATLTLLLGMVTQTVLLTICAFFTAIGLEVLIANMIFSSFLALYFRKDLRLILKSIGTDFKSISIYLKISFAIILFSALLKCAQFPSILDNESYYIQTIKWLNEYGLVRGLANLNAAFGQTSGWHILQSGFNFSFVTNCINDINGFLLVICIFYFLTQTEVLLKQKKQFHWTLFIVFFNVLSFQFINAPSPDMPLFLIGQVVFYLFLKENKTFETTKVITLLLVFLVFLKITIAPIGLLVLLLVYQEKRGTLFLALIGLIFGFLWMAKNVILTGYPLFPFSFFGWNVDWKMPENLILKINNMIQNHEFIGLKDYENFSVIDQFTIWIQFAGINGLFNKGIIVLFILALFTKKIQTVRQYKTMYALLLIHFILVFLVSPQFRFFLIEFIFLASIIAEDLFYRLKVKPIFIHTMLLIAVLLPLLMIFLVDIQYINSNKMNQQTDNFSWSQMLFPESNSRFEKSSFEKHTEGNLTYFSPIPNFFFYGTANGTLPCTNVKIISSNKKKLHIVPQMRTQNLNDGFYSKTITKNKTIE